MIKTAAVMFPVWGAKVISPDPHPRANPAGRSHHLSLRFNDTTWRKIPALVKTGLSNIFSSTERIHFLINIKLMHFLYF
jgi:hypothetical protein